MYYRGKNLSQKNITKIIDSLQDQDNKFIEIFCQEYGKYLTVRQKELGIQTSKQCTIRAEIIQREINKRFPILGIDKRISLESVASRIQTGLQEIQQINTPATLKKSTGVLAPPTLVKYNSCRNVLSAANDLAIKLKNGTAQKYQNNLEIQLKDFKLIVKKKFSDITERVRKDRGYEEIKKNQMLNDMFKNAVEEEFKDDTNQLLISDNSVGSLSSKDHTPPSQDVNPCQTIIQQKVKKFKFQSNDVSLETTDSNTILNQKKHIDHQFKYASKLMRSKSQEEQQIQDKQDSKLVILQQVVAEEPISNFETETIQVGSKKRLCHQQSNKTPKKLTTQRLETIVDIEPVCDDQSFEEDESTPQNEKDESLFQILSNDQPQILEQSLEQESIYHDISYFHRQEIRESHELFNTVIQSNSLENNLNQLITQLKEQKQGHLNDHHFQSVLQNQ